MEIVIDCIIVAFIALTVFFGYKKGLVNLAIGLCSFLIAIIITFILYRPIANIIIEYTEIDESIQNVIMNKNEISNEKEEKEEVYEQILTQVAKPLSYNIVYGGVMILLFVITKISIFFISSLTNFITNLPIIHQFDKAGGILYGIVISFFIINLILLILNFITDANPNNDAYNAIQNTFVTKIMYENNILKLFFK